jgi:signal transduction histidine kinase
LAGTLIGFAGGLTNFFLWYDIMIPPYANIIVSLYVFTLFYAMIKYRLMDARIIARQAFIYVGVSTFTYAFFYLLIMFYNYFFGGVFTVASYVFGMIVAPVFVLVFYNTSKAVQNFANKYFFVSLYSYQETISNLAEELTNHIDFNKIIKLIVMTIKDTMKVDNVNIFLDDKNGRSRVYNIVKVRENEKNAIEKVIDNKNLIGYLNKTQKVLICDELEYLYEEGGKDEKMILGLYCYMKEEEISICLPLTINKKIIGMIILGPKKSKDPYTKEDLELLIVLSRQASVAIENARQYKQIKEFGKVLQEKVDKQIKDIEEKNLHLQELLVMRSDFLKVISHQLNTPLSIIRGYLSMVKEGDYDMKAALPMIETGLYRIIGTVNEFCEAYNLEGDNMKMSFKKTDINKIIKGLVNEKKVLQIVKDKGLRIVLKKPLFKVPVVWCDPEKVRRVVEILIDNAIFYTEKGSVEISYVVHKKYLRIDIKDTGCGISKEDKENLFEKFSRGKRAPNIYPNGSGLGLYIAKKIIEGNKGELFYESEGEGKGSVFSFTVLILKGNK